MDLELLVVLFGIALIIYLVKNKISILEFIGFKKSQEPTKPPQEQTKPPQEPTKPPQEPTKPPQEPTKPPQNNVIGTYIAKEAGGLSYLYYGPDNNVIIYTQNEDNTYSEKEEKMQYSVNGNVITLNTGNATLTGSLQMDGKAIVYNISSSNKLGLYKISNNKLTLDQMTQLISNGQIPGIISADEVSTIDSKMRSLLQ